MTQKVNAFVEQGAWFERDTSMVTVSLTTTSFADPIVIGGQSEEIMRIMQTRGTVIGYTVETDQIAHYMFGHAAGSWGVLTSPGDGTLVGPPPASPPGGTQPDVVAELEAAIDVVIAGTSTITVWEGFKGVAPAVQAFVQPDPPFTP